MSTFNKDENGRKGKQPPSQWLEERIKQTGATPNDFKKYFESEILLCVANCNFVIHRTCNNVPLAVCCAL